MFCYWYKLVKFHAFLSYLFAYCMAVRTLTECYKWPSKTKCCWWKIRRSLHCRERMHWFHPGFLHWLLLDVRLGFQLVITPVSIRPDNCRRVSKQLKTKINIYKKTDNRLELELVISRPRRSQWPLNKHLCN